MALGHRQVEPPTRILKVRRRLRAAPLLTYLAFQSGTALAVGELRLALSDLDNVAVRIADVAAPLTVLVERLRDELGAPTLPLLVARLNVRHPEVHEAVEVIRVGDAQRDRRLVRRRAAANVDDHPDVRKLKVPRRIAVTSAQNASAEDPLVVLERSLDIGHS